ncbi:carbohydrate esterase family 4 protein [Trichoderma longibrachiatum]|uniref:Carbohydrate esterase family 4 protein n=1 Tax=Trichoderma longibrachiatum ATCC 18648 TaxID=983965 RepID=A0A2T4C6E9_TRILO|nr:carbohydrate esterase family 4 protein [Trichoderma longibrachiatum ATCC 18648]
MCGYSTITRISLVTFWSIGAFAAAYVPRYPAARSIVSGSAALSRREANVTTPFALEDYPVTEDGRCGATFGTRCWSDECCSAEGWCGSGFLYCSAPACQYEYGPACDANAQPDGEDTEEWPRPQFGDVPYGKAIYHCQVPGTVALTFDDGPWEYTEELLDILDDHGVKATFFVTGRNLGKGAINDETKDWPRLIRRMKDEGHQIASHTWSHQRLPTLSKARLRQQMIYNEIAIADIIGVFPTYMRPPYSASNEDVDEWLGELGYHVTYFDLDTEGYLHDDDEAIEESKEIARTKLENADPDTDSFLHIEHDTVAHTVSTLISYTIDQIYEAGFTPVTVGECLGDPYEFWYRSQDAGFLKRSVEADQDVVATKRPFYQDAPLAPVVKPRSFFDRLFSSKHKQQVHPTSHSFAANGSLSLNGTLPGDQNSTILYKPTKDGRCGPAFGDASCMNQKFENCCSRAGWCGSTDAHCLEGCQDGYGRCGLFG